MENAYGPAVRDEVVHVQEQHVLLGCQPEQLLSKEWSRFQIERLGRVGRGTDLRSCLARLRLQSTQISDLQHVVRHRIVADIVDAYSKHEENPGSGASPENPGSGASPEKR